VAKMIGMRLNVEEVHARFDVVERERTIGLGVRRVFGVIQSYHSGIQGYVIGETKFSSYDRRWGWCIGGAG